MVAKSPDGATTRDCLLWMFDTNGTRAPSTASARRTARAGPSAGRRNPGALPTGTGTDRAPSPATAARAAQPPTNAHEPLVHPAPRGTNHATPATGTTRARPPGQEAMTRPARTRPGHDRPTAPANGTRPGQPPHVKTAGPTAPGRQPSPVPVRSLLDRAARDQGSRTTPRGQAPGHTPRPGDRRPRTGISPRPTHAPEP
jgi:hypothetical protein